MPLLLVFLCFFNCTSGGIALCGRNVKIVMYAEDACMQLFCTVHQLLCIVHFVYWWFLLEVALMLNLLMN